MRATVGGVGTIKDTEWEADVIKWIILIVCVLVQIGLNVSWFLSHDSMGEGYGLGFSSGFLTGMIALALMLWRKAKRRAQ